MTASADPAFDPVLLDLPEELHTARLLLRPPRPGDGAIVYASLMETLPDLRRFPSSLLWAQAEQTLAMSEGFCRRGAAQFLLRTDFPFMAFDRASGEHMGQCGMHRISWPNRVFEIGWWCRTRYQRTGRMTEAVRAVIDFAWRDCGARRIWCLADTRNEPSWRLAQRVGMRYEGTLHGERSDPDGRRCDMRVYALTR
jgi:RimJ/RimL family protein N-acetyltransferase